MYTLQGPDAYQEEEYDSYNMQIYRNKLQKSSELLQVKLTRDAERSGASWGMTDNESDADNDDDVSGSGSGAGGIGQAGTGNIDDDDDNNHRHNINNTIRTSNKYNSDQSSSSSDLSALKDRLQLYISTHTTPTSNTTSNATSTLTKTQQQFLDKINAKMNKLDNYTTENTRIYNKERIQDTGLTEGQLAVISRNTTAIDKLLVEIEYMYNEQEKKESSGSGGGKKNSSDKKSESAQGGNRSRDRDDDEGGMFDTTGIHIYSVYSVWYDICVCIFLLICIFIWCI